MTYIYVLKEEKPMHNSLNHSEVDSALSESPLSKRLALRVEKLSIIFIALTHQKGQSFQAAYMKCGKNWMSVSSVGIFVLMIHEDKKRPIWLAWPSSRVNKVLVEMIPDPAYNLFWCVFQGVQKSDGNKTERQSLSITDRPQASFFEPVTQCHRLPWKQPLEVAGQWQSAKSRCSSHEARAT